MVVEGSKKIETYTEEELTKLLHTSKENIAQLRNREFIKGIKTGKTYVYCDSAIQDFFEKYEGLDLSNREKIMSAKKR